MKSNEERIEEIAAQTPGGLTPRQKQILRVKLEREEREWKDAYQDEIPHSNFSRDDQ